jgi:hypothetical protein
MSNLLVAVYHLSWSQWECRRHYLQNEGTTLEEQAMDLLYRQVTLESYRARRGDLPPPDHHHFASSLLSRIELEHQLVVLMDSQPIERDPYQVALIYQITELL